MTLEAQVEGITAQKENCPSYSRGYCGFYKQKCYHVNKKERGVPSDPDRCNRLVPRTDDELMEWMDIGLCSDCNEPVCNDCDQYISYSDHENGIEFC
jgi:hypothetical protein